MTDLVAHRGHVARFPENTLAAVRSAAEAGARFVEVDVQLTADRVPVLFHDERLDRVCGVPGSIHDVGASRLARLRASEPDRFGDRYLDEPLATLGAFAEWLSGEGRVHAFVEIKPASARRFGVDAVVDRTLPWLRAVPDRITAISSDVAILEGIRSRSDLPVGGILRAWEERNDPRLAVLDPSVLFIRRDRLPAGRLPDRPPVGVYEIGEPEEALVWAARGVRYIITFRYAAMAEALARRGIS